MADIQKLEIKIALDKLNSPEAQLETLNLLKTAQEESIRAYTHFLQITQINGHEVTPVSLRLHSGTKEGRQDYSISYVILDHTLIT